MATSGSPQAPSQPPPPLAAAAGGNRSSTYDDAISIAEQEVVIAEESGSGKRKKRTKGASPLTLPIYNLSESVLLQIKSFLESDRIRKSNYDIEPCSFAKAIIGNRSHRFLCTVDFEEEQDLAARLSDEDVGGVLACMKDVSKSELKTIDLSLVDDEMKGSDDQPESNLSEIDVVVILDKMLDSKECGTPYIVFPKKWRIEQSQLLDRFLATYNRVMKEREIVCGCCGQNFCGTADKPWVCKDVGETFGTKQLVRVVLKLAHSKNAMKLLATNAYQDCCERLRCLDCCPNVFCEHPDCGFSWGNCYDCSEDEESIKECNVCNFSYCGAHLVDHCFDKGSDVLCSDCEARALLNLAHANECFGLLVQELEDKYSVKGRDCWTCASSDLPQAMDAREELRKRCHAVWEVLLPKQKKFEDYEYMLVRYERYLAWPSLTWQTSRGDYTCIAAHMANIN
ncbi:hypothetical protein ACHAWO_010439 [Cyclotella atomus]|uniref:Uncharacterized protein n=1 Tax=Cyclotella atomus TaxID=382360 RepID=A0ABD3MKP1_9STRA